MVDFTDDWMNPESKIYETKTSKNKMMYAIMRAKRETCFGNPGSIIRWEVWENFDTKKERDEELKKLEKEHPMWQLKAKDYNPYLNYIIGSI